MLSRVSKRIPVKNAPTFDNCSVADALFGGAGELERGSAIIEWLAAAPLLNRAVLHLASNFPAHARG